MSQEQSNESHGKIGKGKEYFEERDKMDNIAQGIKDKKHEDKATENSHASVEKVEEASKSTQQEQGNETTLEQASESAPKAQESIEESAQMVREQAGDPSSREPVPLESGYVQQVKEAVESGTFGLGSQDNK